MFSFGSISKQKNSLIKNIIIKKNLKRQNNLSFAPFKPY